MDRYYTVMIIPEREKGVKSIRIPRLFFRSLAVVLALVVVLLLVLGYDYWQILQQVYENKHLTIENRQLKEQIQLFQMKINSLSDDIGRIHTFERKLRVITGIDNTSESYLKTFIEKKSDQKLPVEQGDDTSYIPRSNSFPAEYLKEHPELDLKLTQEKEEIEKLIEFKAIKENYEKKIAEGFGLQASYSYTKDWSELNKISFGLSTQYAHFDYQFNHVRNAVRTLETNVHELDQHLLDKESFLLSTPTILPAHGWITSYFGPRHSPYSGVLKMHEGMDVGGKIGSPIWAPADGIVTYAGEKSGFGKFVQIDHGYGIETIFGHASSVVVKNGQKVDRGQLIAKLGNSGRSTGPHLHYEVRINGTAVDPLYFILD